jgi:hypothetical protein
MKLILSIAALTAFLSTSAFAGSGFGYADAKGVAAGIAAGKGNIVINGTQNNVGTLSSTGKTGSIAVVDANVFAYSLALGKNSFTSAGGTAGGSTSAGHN